MLYYQYGPSADNALSWAGALFNTAPVNALDGWCMYSIQLWWAIAILLVNSKGHRLPIDSCVLTRGCYARVKALEKSEPIVRPAYE